MKGKELKKRILVSFCICSIIGTIICFFASKQVFELPKPSRYLYINDYCGAFSEETEEYIYEQAKKLNELTNTQIVVVAVENTIPESMTTYCSKLYDKWGISDYGVIILLKIDEHEMWITYGEGLSECFSHQQCEYIKNDYALKDLYKKNYNQAAINTWKAVARNIYNEYNLPVPKELLTSSSVDAYAQSNTFADVTIPKVKMVASKEPMIIQIVKAFSSFWFMSIIPFLFYIIYLRSRRINRCAKKTIKWNNSKL